MRTGGHQQPVKTDEEKIEEAGKGPGLLSLGPAGQYDRVVRSLDLSGTYDDTTLRQRNKLPSFARAGMPKAAQGGPLGTAPGQRRAKGRVTAWTVPVQCMFIAFVSCPAAPNSLSLARSCNPIGSNDVRAKILDLMLSS